MRRGRRLFVPGRGYALREGWNGGAVNAAVWDVVDSEGKLSVSGGELLCAGGRAAPGWGDPLVTAKRGRRLEAGLRAVWRVRLTDLSVAGAVFGVDDTDPIPTEISAGFEVSATEILRVALGAVVYVPVRTLTMGLECWLMVVLGNPGAAWYWSLDGRRWFLVWEAATGYTGTPVYAGINNNGAVFGCGDLRLWYGGRPVAELEGVAAAVARALGAELVTNYDMELDASWANYGAPTTNEQSVDHWQGNGRYSRKYVNRLNFNDGIQSANFAVTAGGWYLFSGYIWPVGANSQWVSIRKGDNSGWEPAVDATSAFTGLNVGAWNQMKGTYRAMATGAGAYVILYNSSLAVNTYYLDNVSIKPITLSSLLTGGGDAGTQFGCFDVALTLGPRYQAGVLLWLDSASNPANYLQAYLDRNTGKVYLVKVVAGVPTDLTSGNVTYSAGATLRVQVVPNDDALTQGLVRVYYNGTLVGTAQTVAVAGFGTLAKGFDTSEAATVDLGVKV